MAKKQQAPSIAAQVTTDAAIIAAPRTKKPTVREIRVGTKAGADDGMKLGTLAFNASKENRELATAAAVAALRPVLLGNNGDTSTKAAGNVTMLRSAFKMDATHFEGLWPHTFRGSLSETANLGRFRDVAQAIADYLAAGNARVMAGQMHEIDEKNFRRAEKALRAIQADSGKMMRLQQHASYVLDALGDLIEPAAAAVIAKARKAADRKARKAAEPAAAPTPAAAVTEAIPA